MAERKLSALLTREEIDWLTRRSDWRGAWAIASTWLVIGLTFAVIARWPTVYAWLLGSLIIAGRQLALAILQHEASHGTLFKTRWMNSQLADLLCARPIWQNLAKYRSHHLGHHAYTGTERDPDISLHAGYPITQASMARKVLRDLTGLTGLKVVYGLILMDAGLIKWTVANAIERLPQEGRGIWSRTVLILRNMSPMLLVNAALWGVLALTGHAYLYGVWLFAFFVPLQLLVRLRSIAEHGCLPRSTDVFANTRTTRAGLLARATVAPVHVNYHLEHHALAAVPYYRLPQMHRLLRAKNLVPAAPSYWQVLRLASSG